MSSRLAAGLPAVIAAAGVVAGAVIETGLPVPPSQWMLIVLGLLLPVPGWLLASRRPEVRLGWLLLAGGVCFGLAIFGAGLAARGHSTPLIALAAGFYGLTWIFVPLLFPDGRLPSRRWRPVAWISGIAIAAHTAGIALIGYDPYQPLVLPATGGGLVAAMAATVGQFVTWVMAVVVYCGLVLRWRRSERAERGQYAWMVGGMTATLAGGVLMMIASTGGPEVAAIGVVAVLAALPTAIVVAVVRYRLLDIRIGVRGSRLHLVFDVRPTVDEVLSDLGTTLDATPEPVELLGGLAAVVRGGLEVRWAAVRLADGTRVVAGHEEGAVALTVPVRDGHIECGPREDGGGLTRGDRRFLEALAVPAGLAIQSAGLVTRLVNAQEAERRRIERNIHDGVQQQLVALIAGLELARATGAGPDMLALLREQARQTLTDLRELAAGIHPSSLSQGGLVEAVEERCSRLHVRTTVTSAPSLRAARFSDEVEGAMYFTVSEVVANALKHADAGAIEVRLSRSGGRLHATVTDDGKGFDPRTAGRGGLATLSDRMDALGGGLEIVSEPGKGTRMNAWVPVDG
ncbi:ATP-binding protein [Nonomuraea sp. K274]|uniref:histidine kinase n=1 Tax=Nonomuraea cypriaca TaxID=1187855 RepID=A0A931AHN2_9ACTN|nr:ATP-binding protein [Nonomuraea cypriaca]MBF8190668.1 ATP-binding protein [Nonomuraea cypriaca]